MTFNRPPPALISIVVPCFNEARSIPALLSKMNEVLKSEWQFELIFVDDGSTDETIELLRSARAIDRRVKYLSLSRNFGHQAALRAGLAAARGQVVITMDADLQHPPELLSEMIAQWRAGYDLVLTARSPDSSISFKSLTSRLFYNVMMRLSDLKLDPGSADFRLLDHSIVKILSRFDESSFFLRGIVSWLGFRQSTIRFTPHERIAGKSRYSFRKMCTLALDGLTGFSIRPLRLSIFLGMGFSVLAFLYAAYAIYVKFILLQAIPGWTSVLVSILLLGGIQLIVLGIIGEYLGKLFIQSLGRPPYLIASQELED